MQNKTMLDAQKGLAPRGGSHWRHQTRGSPSMRGSPGLCVGWGGRDWRLLPSSSSSEVMDLERRVRAVVGARFGGGGAAEWTDGARVRGQPRAAPGPGGFPKGAS